LPPKRLKGGGYKKLYTPFDPPSKPPLISPLSRKMSTNVADSIDDLVSSFSKTHLNETSQNDLRKSGERPSIDGPSALSLKLLWDCEIQEFDGVAIVVQNLRTQLDETYSDKHIGLDDHCVKSAREHLVRWRAPELALENFLELARGNPTFPIIMLLNPFKWFRVSTICRHG
jgi:hypothetical protein